MSEEDLENLIFVLKTSFTFRQRTFKGTNDANLSLILLSIVAVFLFCHFPRLLLNMAEFIGNDLEEDDDKLIKPTFYSVRAG